MTERGPLDFGDEPREGQAPAGAERGSSASQPARPARRSARARSFGPSPRPRPPGASRYGWFLGVVAFVLLVVVTINSISSEGVEGGGPAGGKRLPPFAVPLADSSLEGDANLATKPGQDQLGPRPACEVRGPEILNVCEEWELGPVVLALFPSDADRCRSVLEQLRRMKGRFPGVRFAAVGSRGDRDALRGAWGFPVGWDRDGAVAARYGLVGCPQVTFARRGGVVVDTARRELSDAEFEAEVRALR